MDPRLLCFIVLTFIVLTICEARRGYGYGSRSKYGIGGYRDREGSGYSRGYSSSQLVQCPRCHKGKTLLEVLVLDKSGMPVANADVIKADYRSFFKQKDLTEKFETDNSGKAKFYAMGCQTTLIISKKLNGVLNRIHHQVNLKDCKTSRRKEIVVLDTILLDIIRSFDSGLDQVIDAIEEISEPEDECPPDESKICEVSKYREMDGSCNNLDNFDWGKADTTFVRFIDATYGDGIETPRLSSKGKPLPSPRLVSTRVHSENIHESPKERSNILRVVFCQFLAHDMTLTEEPEEPKPNCCSDSERERNPECFPIEIPEDDEFFSKFGKTCMNFVRTPATDCKPGPRAQSNQITSVIDANTVYSNEIDDDRELRTFVGGKMRTLPAFRKQGLKDLLPLNKEEPDQICMRPKGRDDLYCFLAGEIRANEQVLLAVMHLLFVREHNRLADELSKINPHWNDETLYQEARRIVGAMNQHITFTESLPLTLGTKVMRKFGLETQPSGFFRGYNDEVNPGMASGFITAAGRIGHSQLPSEIELRNKRGEVIKTQELSTVLLQPFDLFTAHRVDEYTRGMLKQPSEPLDSKLTDEVTNRLFERRDYKIPGMDLAALNIQRGRDHGVPSYNRWREWCGLKPINKWRDLNGIVGKTAVKEYPKLYESPEDIDLFSGGLSEIHEDGASVGPTFACIIGRQFRNLRVGDRFWYENPGWPSSFTIAQLQEIRKTSIARVICDNSDDIEEIQPKAMLLHSPKNPITPCSTDEIPRLNIQAWKDKSAY